MTRRFSNRNNRQNCCPSCRKYVEGDSALVFGDLVCPHCRKLLWFFGSSDEQLFFEFNEAAPLREKVVDYLSTKFSIDRERINGMVKFTTELGADSLDQVEVLMELFEMFEEFEGPWDEEMIDGTG